MPPLRILSTEPHPDGGIIVEWHDEMNGQGLPLVAKFHLTSGRLDELCRAQEALGAPTVAWLRQACALLDPAVGFVDEHGDGPLTPIDTLELKLNPREVAGTAGKGNGSRPDSDEPDIRHEPDEATRRFLDGWLTTYEAIIGDRIDRSTHGLKGSAPHEVLQRAREGTLGADDKKRWGREDRKQGAMGAAPRVEP